MNPQVCFLKHNGLAYASTADVTGKLLPKNGTQYQIVIKQDNPDISSLTTEVRMTEQACFQTESILGIPLKIWTWDKFLKKHSEKEIDVLINFTDSDSFFTDNILAYTGYPSGSFKGKVVFNNKFPWLDGQPRTGAELAQLGIILPGMNDKRVYQTYNYRQTIKHELCGHSFGLQHNIIEDNSVMNAYYRIDRNMLEFTDQQIYKSKYTRPPNTWRELPYGYIKGVMTRPI